jgi:uncharacterized protein YqfB (UPF0267 family)
MQFKPVMIEAIKAGRKTQTRRPVKPGDFRLWDRSPVRPGTQVIAVCDVKGRLRWRNGGRYSVCPGRGKDRVGLIQITGIGSERVDKISEQDARAEGFESREAFLAAWKALYPKGNLEANVWVLEFKVA